MDLKRCSVEIGYILATFAGFEPIRLQSRNAASRYTCSVFVCFEKHHARKNPGRGGPGFLDVDDDPASAGIRFSSRLGPEEPVELRSPVQESAGPPAKQARPRSTWLATEARRSCSESSWMGCRDTGRRSREPRGGGERELGRREKPCRAPRASGRQASSC